MNAEVQGSPRDDTPVADPNGDDKELAASPHDDVEPAKDATTSRGGGGAAVDITDAAAAAHEDARDKVEPACGEGTDDVPQSYAGVSAPTKRATAPGPTDQMTGDDGAAVVQSDGDLCDRESGCDDEEDEVVVSDAAEEVMDAVRRGNATDDDVHQAPREEEETSPGVGDHATRREDQPHEVYKPVKRARDDAPPAAKMAAAEQPNRCDDARKAATPGVVLTMDAPQDGARIEVWWGGDGMWYPAEVLFFDTEEGTHDVRYTDDDVEETLDLREDEWRPAPEAGSTIAIYCEADKRFHDAVVRCMSDGVGHLRYAESGKEKTLDLRYELWQPRPDAPFKPSLVIKTEEQGGDATRVDRNHTPNVTSGQEPTEVSLDNLIAHVVQNGGTPDMLHGWRCLRYVRGGRGSKRSDGSYYVFEDPTGSKKRSKREVIRALGIRTISEGGVNE